MDRPMPASVRKFLSTPSARRATTILWAYATLREFLSTPSARRATLHPPGGHQGYREISIHALREEGDSTASPGWYGGTYFYPRPPRGGRLLGAVLVVAVIEISIHALREEGDLELLPGLRVQDISIHALREEGDS